MYHHTKDVILDQYVLSYQRWIKSVIKLGNYEVLKTLTKTLTFVDADANANANARSSTIARLNYTICTATLDLQAKDTEPQNEYRLSFSFIC